MANGTSMTLIPPHIPHSPLPPWATPGGSGWVPWRRRYIPRVVYADFIRFRPAFQYVYNPISQSGKSLSTRDMYLIQIGMHTARIEDANAAGDTVRAQEHLNEILELLPYI